MENLYTGTTNLILVKRPFCCIILKNFPYCWKSEILLDKPTTEGEEKLQKPPFFQKFFPTLRSLFYFQPKQTNFIMSFWNNPIMGFMPI